MSCFTCLRSGADDDVESGADGLSSSRGDRKPKGKRGGKGAVVHDVNVSMTVVAEKEKEEIRRSDMKRRSLHHKGSSSSSALSGGKDEPTPTAAAVAPAHVRITTASSKHEQGELDVLSKRHVDTIGNLHTYRKQVFTENKIGPYGPHEHCLKDVSPNH